MKRAIWASLLAILVGGMWTLPCDAAAAEKDAKPSGPCTVVVELRDGSRIRGVADAGQLTFRTSFGKTDVPLRLVETVRIDANGETGQAVLRAGDRVRGTVDRLRLGLTTVFGKVAVPMAHVRLLTVVPNETPPELILWNRLDGSPSVVGPEVSLLKIDKHVPGHAGQGVKVAGNHEWAFRVPSSILEDLSEGTIEFWVKVVSKPPTVGYGSAPIYDFFDGPAHFQLNANDGCDHGGFSLNTSGHFVYTEFAERTKSTDLLGKPGEWVHYAIVWNNDGIADTDNIRLALYINGKSHGQYEPSSRRTYLFLPNREGKWLTFHRNRNGFAGTMVYDELRIWKKALSDKERRERAASPSTKRPKSKFAVDLRDGSHLRGEVAVANLKLKSSGLGAVDVPLEQVKSIAIDAKDKTAKILFRRGDVVVGDVEDANLPMKTLLGNLQLPVAEISAIKRIAPETAGN